MNYNFHKIIKNFFSCAKSVRTLAILPVTADYTVYVIRDSA